jgi:hypothetical protein
MLLPNRIQKFSAIYGQGEVLIDASKSLLQENFMKNKPEEFNLSDFIRTVYGRVWSFQMATAVKIEERNTLEVFDKLDEERQLLALAEQQGTEPVRIFCSAVFRAKEKLIERTREEKAARIFYALMDEDVQRYEQRLHNHDWFYSFSDDIAVYRRGSVLEEELKEMAKASPLHQKLWDYYATECARAISGK